METKFCYRCTSDLPLSEFGVDRKRKDGLACYCKKCCNSMTQNAYAKYGEEIRQKRRDKYAASKTHQLELMPAKKSAHPHGRFCNCRDCYGAREAARLAQARATLERIGFGREVQP